MSRVTTCDSQLQPTAVSPMPSTRRQHKDQRLSDFFPAIGAPSPIATSTNSASKHQPRTTSTPSLSRRHKDLRKTKRPTNVQSTPKFDPELSFSEDDINDSEEEAFVNSLTFSPIKTALKSPDKIDSAVGQDRVREDFQVVVDYNSESDGFAFSPVKFSPATSQLKKRKYGTPKPAKSRQVSKMVWNSATKKVEQAVVIVPGATPLRRRFTPASTQTFVSSDRLDASGLGAEVEAEGLSVEMSGKNTDLSLSELSRKMNSTSPTTSSCVQVLPERRAPGSKQTSSESSPEMMHKRVPPVARLRRDPAHGRYGNSSSSPPVRLIRAISGSAPMQILEKLALPDYVLEEHASKPRQGLRPKSQARLPKKIPVTVPKPFALSKAKSKASTDAKSNVVNKENIAAVADAADPEWPVSLPEQPTSVSKKRKASDDHETGGLRSPAKRIKVVDHGARPMAPLRASRNSSRMVTSNSSFPASTKLMLESRTRLKHQTINVTKFEALQEPGLVPRTLYSPERQLHGRQNSSPTKPQPFTFSTEARANRSPMNKTPVQIKAALRRPSQRVRVPALELAPFVPRPSALPVTVAESPARKLPSRIEIRREFDKVAERHAEEMMKRKRSEEESLAAERERRIEERKGWKSQGMAAIESWASRANEKSHARRDWID